MAPPLVLHYAPTPNGWKVSILLEELVSAGLLARDDFEVVLVDLARGEQFAPSFLRVSPNGRMPALEDREQGITVFESAAIMQYLSERCGGAFWSGAPPGSAAALKERYAVTQWLFWQMAGLGYVARICACSAQSEPLRRHVVPTNLARASDTAPWPAK
jgi:GST-like protein